MKIRINILSLLFALSCLYGCSADESLMDLPQVPSEPEQAQVVLSISVPEVSLPLSSTRAITDDKGISNLAIWAFDENGKFLYQLTTDDKDDKGNSIVVQRGSTIYMLLPKSEQAVTLAIMTNLDFETMRKPIVGASKAEAISNLKFNYSDDISYIPMYGESTPFIVKEGANPGTIRLKRALAKIEVNINEALEDFRLEEVTVVNVNTEGTVAQLENITNSVKNNITTKASSPYKWVGYIPEAANIDLKETRVSLVLKGRKNGYDQSRYYRLDFIKRAQSSENVEYDYISTIERNKRYAFKIEYISSAGSASLEEAVNKDEADNAITHTELMTINDEEIRDITTDSQYYLGVTSSEITAKMDPLGGQLFYTANMSVVTNNPDGWKIETKDLPEEVNVSVKSFTPGTVTETATSIWIYIDKKFTGDEVTLYVYSGRIRKSVRISIVK